MFATEATHYIRELSHCISSKIRRCLAFQVNAEFPCDSDGEVVYLMDERILELTAGCGRPDANQGTENSRVRVGASGVWGTFIHQVNGLVYDTPRCFRMTETRHDALDVVLPLGKEEIHYPAANL